MSLATDLATFVSPKAPGELEIHYIREELLPVGLIVWGTTTGDGKGVSLCVFNDKVVVNDGITQTTWSQYSSSHSDVISMFATKNLEDTGF